MVQALWPGRRGRRGDGHSPHAPFPKSDVYRPARFVKNVRVVTFKDVNVEELAKRELELPKEGGF